MLRRKNKHDYRKKGTYMITIIVAGRKPVFGTIVGDPKEPYDSENAARLLPSALGEIVIGQEIQKISQVYPMVKVWHYCVMPDHIHLILRVIEDMPDGKHLGKVIYGFKTGCTRAWWALNEPQASTIAPGGKTPGTVVVAGAPAPPELQAEATVAGAPAPPVLQAEATVAGAFPPAPKRPVLFEAGYNDGILMREGQLNNWRHYLSDNPRRLLIKRQNPQYFVVKHEFDISKYVGGKPLMVEMVGNRFLLDIPDKMAVIVHRRYTDTEYENLCQQWLACGEHGGVLISAAIAPKEAAVMAEARKRGYRIIWLRDHGFTEYYKPSGQSFEACEKGQLLQISPWAYTTRNVAITRDKCLYLNSIAEAIASNGDF